MLFFGPLGTNVGEISIQIHTFVIQKCFWKFVGTISAGLSRHQSVELISERSVTNKQTHNVFLSLSPLPDDVVYSSRKCYDSDMHMYVSNKIRVWIYSYFQKLEALLTEAHFCQIFVLVKTNFITSTSDLSHFNFQRARIAVYLETSQFWNQSYSPSFALQTFSFTFSITNNFTPFIYSD